MDCDQIVVDHHAIRGGLAQFPVRYPGTGLNTFLQMQNETYKYNTDDEVQRK